MKNKYLTKFLCLTLASGMTFADPASVMAAEDIATYSSDDFSSDSDGFDSDISQDLVPEVPEEPTPEEPTPTPEDPVTPIPTPEDPVSPTPTPENPVSPTPTPENPVSPTPIPVSPTPTPQPSVSPTPTPQPSASPTPTPGNTATPTPAAVSDKVKDIINRITEMHKKTLVLDNKSMIQSIRTAYNALSAEEKLQVTNYNLLVEMEKTIENLEEEKKKENQVVVDFSDNVSSTAAVQTGQAVYFTDMAANLHAGKDFYLDSLKNNYQLTFSDDFASVMDAIEKEYKEKNKLTDSSDTNGTGVTSSADSLLVRNWQDILAIYIYQQSQQGKTEFTLDASCKDALAEIFAEMNPVVRDKQDITRVTYGNRHINYYIKKNGIAKSDRTVLKKYVETDCKLLCAVVTAAKGFVRESVGDDVSEERVNVIAAAYSLVGKVGYFWGGKSTVIGEDPAWGSAATVAADGSNSTGTLRAYGLDCSGFVTWAVINGYKDQGMQAVVGDGTSDQWERANVVSEADAQPGDLVFQRGPEAGSDNHVGILCGKTDAGDWIAVHCSSSKNGVTVGEAYSASFRYIRQPSFYPDVQEQQTLADSSFAFSSANNILTSDVTVNTMLPSSLFTSTAQITPQADFTSILDLSQGEIADFSKIDLSDGQIEVFKAK